MVLVQNVSKLYRLYRRPSDRLRELLPGARAHHSDFWALKDIGFEVVDEGIKNMWEPDAAAMAKCVEYGKEFVKKI